MTTLQIDKLAAWMATLLCTVIAGRAAQAFGSRASRIFATFALLGLYWAVLLVYYGGPSASELLPALNGFLLVYTGGILRRHAAALPHARTKGHVDEPIGALDKWAVWLLLILVVPSAISLPWGKVAPPQELISRIEAALGTAMTLLGFVSVLHALQKLARPTSFRVLASILLLYSILEIAYTIQYWSTPSAALPPPAGSWWEEPSRAPMTQLFRWSFAVMKLLFSVSFVYTLTRAVHPRLTRRMILEHFLDVANHGEQMAAPSNKHMQPSAPDGHRG
jgi:hypothetical protein